MAGGMKRHHHWCLNIIEISVKKKYFSLSKISKRVVNLSLWADRQANGLLAHPRSNVISWLALFIGKGIVTKRFWRLFFKYVLPNSTFNGKRLTSSPSIALLVYVWPLRNERLISIRCFLLLKLIFCLLVFCRQIAVSWVRYFVALCSQMKTNAFTMYLQWAKID